MFYPAFDAFLVSAFPDSSVSVAATLLPQVRDIIRHVFAAGSSALLEDARAGFRCFQLFGFDFMMDQDCRVRAASRRVLRQPLCSRGRRRCT